MPKDKMNGHSSNNVCIIVDLQVACQQSLEDNQPKVSGFNTLSAHASKQAVEEKKRDKTFISDWQIIIKIPKRILGKAKIPSWDVADIPKYM